MKLFQRLLVAPAALGLLAPLSANATEVNLNEISNYSDVESIDLVNTFDDNASNQTTLLAGGEGLVDSDSFDGGFSETTTASFGVNFYAGINDDDDAAPNTEDNLMTGYDFSISLNTSFTGEDSLDIAIDAGNAGAEGILEFGGDTGESLSVDEITYTFPLGDKTTIQVGDNNDASALFTTACVYGTPSDTLDACGNVNAAVDNGGVMLGAAYDFGNGLTAAVGYAGSETDVANEEGVDAYGFNVAYTGDNYGVSFTYGALEDNAAAPQDNMGVDTHYAFNGYFDPESEGLPSISVGYELGEDASVEGDADGLTNFFVGLGWDEFGPGELGIGMGTHTNTVEDTDAQYMYEVYYSYAINDGMTITPLLFVKDVSTANTDDTTGVMVKTSFSF